MSSLQTILMCMYHCFGDISWCQAWIGMILTNHACMVVNSHRYKLRTALPFGYMLVQLLLCVQMCR